MNPVDLDRMWMGVAAMLLIVIAILGATRLLDLDDAQLRYPNTTLAPTVYAPGPLHGSQP